jgi:hypothetical protein
MPPHTLPCHPTILSRCLGQWWQLLLLLLAHIVSSWWFTVDNDVPWYGDGVILQEQQQGQQ